MKMFRLLVSVGAAALLGISAGAAEIMVFAAASLADVLTELAPAYARATIHTARFNFGASGALTRQIKQGAPADVFFSADELRVDQLDRAGLLLTETRRVVVANQLVVVVGADAPVSITRVADLAKDGVRRVAIGEPATVPAGTYTKEYLQRNGSWKPLLDKMVPLDNVRAVLAAVAAGNADAGFVYLTDARASRQVRIALEVPLADGPKIVYPVAVLKDSKSPDAARAFVAFLAGAEAQAVFAKHGFLPPPS